MIVHGQTRYLWVTSTKSPAAALISSPVIIAAARGRAKYQVGRGGVDGLIAEYSFSFNGLIAKASSKPLR